MRLELLDEDANPVLVAGPMGDDVALEIEGEFEAGRPPGLKAGTPLDMMLAINLPPQPLAPGGRYVWQLHLDDETHDDWRLTFTTRPPEAGPDALSGS